MGILRDFDLAKYNCDVYVETGTGAGGTLSKAMPHFKKCYSVDMDLDCVSNARNRFPSATIAHDLSIAALEQWLKHDLSSAETVLFFLDAHFPGSDYRGEPYDVSAPNAVPLEQELRLIKKYRPNANDVIICDDARIYTIAEFEHGNTEWLQVPGGYQFVHEIFPDANIKLTMSEEGYIIIDRRVTAKKNILVIRPAALGDVIMATGIVRALKQRHPQAAVDVATTEGADVTQNQQKTISQLKIEAAAAEKQARIDSGKDVIVGVNKYFEIWSPQRWQERVTAMDTGNDHLFAQLTSIKI
jgi:hypothetical protein